MTRHCLRCSTTKLPILLDSAHECIGSHPEKGTQPYLSPQIDSNNLTYKGYMALGWAWEVSGRAGLRCLGAGRGELTGNASR
jgi:hypothetical protein